MDQFSYLSVLLSIILGLAITQVLKGFRGILLGRMRLRMYWPTLAWAVLLLFIYVQNWWTTFTLREIEAWTFPAFIVILSESIILYMLAALVFPDFSGADTIDLRAHYYDHAGWFFMLMVAALLDSLAKDLVLNGHLPERVNVEFHLGFIATSLIAALTKREWYHKAFSLASIVAFGTYTMLLFSHLH